MAVAPRKLICLNAPKPCLFNILSTFYKWMMWGSIGFFYSSISLRISSNNRVAWSIFLYYFKTVDFKHYIALHYFLNGNIVVHCLELIFQNGTTEAMFQDELVSSIAFECSKTLVSSIAFQFSKTVSFTHCFWRIWQHLGFKNFLLIVRDN